MDCDSMESTILLPTSGPEIVNEVEEYYKEHFTPKIYVLEWKLQKYLETGDRQCRGLDGWYVKFTPPRYPLEILKFSFGNDNPLNDIEGKQKIAKGMLSLVSIDGRSFFSKDFRCEYNYYDENYTLNEIELSVDNVSLNLVNTLFLPDGALTIRLEFTTYFLDNSIDREGLSAELNMMFYGKRYADVSICTSNEIVTAHKSVLSARSGYFEKLLQDSKVLDFSNLDSTTVKSIIKYLYTGNPNWFLDDMTRFGLLKEAYEAVRLFQLDELEKTLSNRRTQKFQVHHPSVKVKQNVAFEWKINNFQVKPGVVLESPHFFIRLEDESKCRILFYEHQDAIQMSLEVEFTEALENFGFQCVLHDDSGNIIRRFTVNESADEHLDKNVNCCCPDIIFLSGVAFESKSHLPLPSTLTVNCYISYGNSTLETHNSIEYVSYIIDDLYPYNHETILSKNMKDLLESQKDYDCTISIGNQSMPCHFAICSTRLHLAYEKFEDKIVLEGNAIDLESFREIMLYLYTGRMGKASLESIKTIVAFAEQHCLPALKALCLK